MSQWQSVLNPETGKYADSFDPEATCEFRRRGHEGVATYRMSDQDPHFNIWGLEWRHAPVASAT